MVISIFRYGVKHAWMIATFAAMIFVSSCSLAPTVPRANSYPVADIMYLIPPDESKVEDWAKPEKLIANQQNMSIGVTTSWEHINRLAKDKETFAVIIHHAAVDQIDREQLSYLFRRKWFVVTGLGIPSDEIYKLIGMSNLFVNKPDYCPTASGCGFTTQAYYLTLAYRIEGLLEDIEIIEASTDVRGDISVDGKVAVVIGRATNSLLDGDEAIVDMVLEMEIQIRSINRKDIYDTEWFSGRRQFSDRYRINPVTDIPPTLSRHSRVTDTYP